MLSPITSTVTVAPLTISTCGAGAAPRATRSMSVPINLLTASRMRFSGMPTQHDGLLVLDQLEAGQHALRIDTDQKLDRLAGIARGVGKVGVQVDEAEQLIVLVGGRNRGIALQRPEAIRARNQFGRLGLGKVFARAGLRRTLRPSMAIQPKTARIPKRA